MLKSASGWYNNGNGTDAYGFSALSGGYRHPIGSFLNADGYGYWWTATANSNGYVYGRRMYYGNDLVYENDFNAELGFSVRCVKSDN